MYINSLHLVGEFIPKHFARHIFIEALLINVYNDHIKWCRMMGISHKNKSYLIMISTGFHAIGDIILVPKI